MILKLSLRLQRQNKDNLLHFWAYVPRQIFLHDRDRRYQYTIGKGPLHELIMCSSDGIGRIMRHIGVMNMMTYGI